MVGVVFFWEGEERGGVASVFSPSRVRSEKAGKEGGGMASTGGGDGAAVVSETEGGTMSSEDVAREKGGG